MITSRFLSTSCGSWSSYLMYSSGSSKPVTLIVNNVAMNWPAIETSRHTVLVFSLLSPSLQVTALMVAPCEAEFEPDSGTQLEVLAIRSISAETHRHQTQRTSAAVAMSRKAFDSSFHLSKSPHQHRSGSARPDIPTP